MTSKLQVPIMSLVIVLSLISLCLGESEMQCQGHDMKYNSTQMEQTKECLGYHGTTSIWKLKSTDFPCFGMCMLKSRDFLGDDGEHVVLQRVMEYIDMIAPEKAKAGLKDMLTNCVKLHGDKVRSKDDPKSCMTFMEVGHCFRDAFVEIC
ncbi:unnamed protein product, partial [Allacma fusca]